MDIKLDINVSGEKFGVDDHGGILQVCSLGLKHLKVKYYDYKKKRYVELDVGRWINIKYE